MKNRLLLTKGTVYDRALQADAAVGWESVQTSFPQLWIGDRAWRIGGPLETPGRSRALAV
jgi:hypothetical protein